MTTVPSDWTHVFPQNCPPYSVFTKQINKSDKDNREYRIIRLENGLQALLVHDPDADKAAASLDVAVGQMHDPDDMNGLAHFCEHLLFMGTEQFPKENEYSEYLSKNNGTYNAFTGISNTNYYFAVSTGAFLGAIQRFSGFFHCPLFAPSCTARELSAVNSEHEKNKQSDGFRLHQLSRHLSKPGHPWKKFGTGHRDCLLAAARELKAKGLIGNDNESGTESEADGGAVGRETRRRLVEWWEREYCASRMRLCLVSKESLDELSEIASTYFSPIKNRGRDPTPMVNEQPWGEAEKGTLISVQSIMDFLAMDFTFELEYQAPLWRHKPAKLISHFFGHEGPGSLHSYLKAKGWITALSTYHMELARGNDCFKVMIYLTEEGFTKYESVIQAVYQYLSLLRSSTLEAYHQDESSTISNIEFRFAEKKNPADYAVALSQKMVWPVPPEHILDGPNVRWPWSEFGEEGGKKKVKEYLERNFRISEGRAMLIARAAAFDKIYKDGVEWEEEPWYGTKYNVRKFDAAFIEQADRPNEIKELYLPSPNEFIPKNLDVEKKEGVVPEKRPHLIRETPLSTLWYKKDDRFWVPKANVQIDFRSPACNASARAAVLTEMYSYLVSDALEEYSYAASIAGLSYTFSARPTGVHVDMKGYNDKMSVLAQHVLEKVKGLKVNEERLAVMKEQAKRNLENFSMVSTYFQSEYFLKYLLSEQDWTHEEKLAEISSITAEEVQAHIASVLSRVNVRILITGSVNKEEAVKIAEMVENGLPESSLSPAELSEQCLILSDGANLTWTKDLSNPQESNSALTYYLHFGSKTDQRTRVLSNLLAQTLADPAFNTLRTKEQLGYIVACGIKDLPGETARGLRILVQSEKNPDYLEERVEAFLKEMKGRLEEMSLEEFESHKEGLGKKLLEADKNLDNEAARFYAQISTGQLDFLRSENDAEFLKSVTKEDLLDLFTSRILPSSASRAKLSVHMRAVKPRQKKVSDKAATEFVALVQDKKLVDEAADVNGWKELGNTPSLEAFTKFWEGLLAGKEGAEEVLKALPEIVDRHVADGEGEYKKFPGVEYVEDKKKFKESLKVSGVEGPLVQWEDLSQK